MFVLHWGTRREFDPLWRVGPRTRRAPGQSWGSWPPASRRQWSLRPARTGRGCWRGRNPGTGGTVPWAQGTGTTPHTAPHSAAATHQTNIPTTWSAHLNHLDLLTWLYYIKSTNYELPHCEGLAHSPFTSFLAQISFSGFCFQVPLACIPPSVGTMY